ncbi:MAG: type I-U CRISPR-associated protein Csx17 [Phormidesmis sp.]
MKLADMMSFKQSHQRHTWQAIGCGLEPIADYLKALGLLRVLPHSKGWWQNGEFWIEGDRPPDEVIDYLTEQASVTPLFNPWNGDSGFWTEGRAKEAIRRLASVKESDRTKRYVKARDKGLAIVAASGLKKQPSKGNAKNRLIQACQSRITDSDWQAWYKTVVQLVEVTRNNKTIVEAKGSRLLGTQGNLGGGNDLGANYLDAWSRLIDLETGNPLNGAKQYWQASIFGQSLPKSLDNSPLLAQYAPVTDYTLDSKAYPYQKSGGGSTAAANPADVVLLTEGLLTFSSIAKRPLDSSDSSVAFYSLAVNLAAGIAQTSVSGELRAGVEEFWLPIWNQPKSFEGLRSDLLTELRGPLPKQTALDTFDFVELLSNKAAERKIPQWSRYAFFPRKGQTNFAISLGIFTPGGYNLGAELDSYRRSLCRFGYSDISPGQIGALARQLEAQLFALASGHGQVLQTLALLGDIELYLTRSPASQEKIQSLPQLDSDWIVRALSERETPTVRLALSLASLWLRSHLSNARLGKNNRWFWGEEPVTWSGDLSANLIALQRRWAIRVSQGKQPYPDFRINATFADISAFLSGNVDPVELTRLAVGFSLCKMPKTIFSSLGADLIKLPALYSLAAYCQWSAVGIGSGMNQIASGNSEMAAQTVSQRLRANDLSPFAVPQACTNARQTAAALAFPLSDWQLNQIKTYLLKDS